MAAAFSLPREEPVVGEAEACRSNVARGPVIVLVGSLGAGEGGQPWSPMNIHDPVLEVDFLRCILAKLYLDKVMSFSRGRDTLLVQQFCQVRAGFDFASYICLGAEKSLC